MDNRDELKYILLYVTDLLKFGEAKHGGLIILNSAIIIGILTSYSTINHIIYKPVILLGASLQGLSIFLSIASQFPMTSTVYFSKKEITNANLYFFGHLACLDREKFISAYKLMDETFAPTQFDIAIIDQILVIARIANSKFLYFKISSYLSALGMGIIGLSTILKIFIPATLFII